MNENRWRLVSRLICFLGCAIACIAMGLLHASAWGAGGTASNSVPTVLTTLGFKFNGSPTCSSEKCHGADKATERPDFWGNEYTLWHGRLDPHHLAYRTLISAKSKEMAAKLRIGPANKSERCLHCHSTVAAGPTGQDLQGRDYSSAEGVSCDACHGPSEKYLEPHAQQGWIARQRTAMSYADLLKSTGLYDTKPVIARAERCTGCHLTTDADLVAAGHPQPVFELYHFSQSYPDRHWRDAGGAFASQVWLDGQVIELREVVLRLARLSAAAPVAPAELKRSFDRAAAHYSVLQAVLSKTAGAGPELASLKSDFTKLAAAVSGGDTATFAGLAAAVAQDADRLQPVVAKISLDASTAASLLPALADLPIAADLGEEGAQQQGYAIEVLAKIAGAPAITAALAPFVAKKPSEPPTPSEFAKVLQDVRSKIPK